MKIMLSVPRPDDGGRLTAAAKLAWQDFNSAMTNPLGKCEVMCGITDMDANTIAASEPLYLIPGIPAVHEWAHLILPAALLTSTSETHRRLTLLHECLHMAFAFGEHRERWRRMQLRIEGSEVSLNAMVTTETSRLNYMWRRNYCAFIFLRLPDEIVAEQRLKRDYPEWFEARAAYYVHMRQDHETEIVAPKSDVPLQPFHIFYELLRTSFFISLVAGMPQFVGELKRLEKNAEDRLRELAPRELFDFLLQLKPRLLGISLNRPLTDAEAAYDELLARVIATEQDAQTTAAS